MTRVTQVIGYCRICGRQRRLFLKGNCLLCSDKARAEGALRGAKATKEKYEAMKQEAGK